MPVLKGVYKKGVIIPEKNISKLIEKFGWVKVVFYDIKSEGSSLPEFFGAWKSLPETEKAIGKLKKEWRAWAIKA